MSQRIRDALLALALLILVAFAVYRAWLGYYDALALLVVCTMGYVVGPLVRSKADRVPLNSVAETPRSVLRKHLWGMPLILLAFYVFAFLYQHCAR